LTFKPAVSLKLFSDSQSSDASTRASAEYITDFAVSSSQVRRIIPVSHKPFLESGHHGFPTPA